MKTLLKILPVITLLAPVGLFTSGCVDEGDDFEDADQLRPAQSACPPCYIGGNQVYLGISTAYKPSHILNTSLLITNSAGSELRDYGSGLSVPNDPDTIAVTDNELCTVGQTGQPPSQATIMFQVMGDAGPTTVIENIAITSTCP